ncbi:unnamed protein product [Ceutorhynchus assimilis]|uniref:CHK kinase-like domain-containing protein n=1 Tax=Ceutorhynchus assimilis TaxID=467358 RepID=A0A9N9QMB2_9CUCU|nr:unnamed protein product [Ceutorhynchus assimilis]
MAEFTEIKKLNELIKDYIAGEVVEQRVERLVPAGENYGSVLYKVDFKVKFNGIVKPFYGVAKCTPPNKVTQEIFATQVSFKTEIGWYTTVIPTLKMFQRIHEVAAVDFFQNFYGARISLDPNSDVVDEDGVILTQNLNTLGYKNVDRHTGFDLKTSKSVLRDLATFHAIPWAIKRQNPNLFNRNILPFLPKTERILEKSDPFASIRKGLKDIPELQPYLEKVFHIFESNDLFDESEPDELWGSVGHGDFWSNNIMVTEDEDPKTIILDLQEPCYASIAADIIFLAVISINLEVAKTHLDYLIEGYWINFLMNVRELGCDIRPLTFQRFLDELKVQAKKQLGHAMFISQFVYMEKGHTAIDSSDETFTRDNLKFDNIKFGKTHKERYTWVIQEFNKRNWI